MLKVLGAVFGVIFLLAFLGTGGFGILVGLASLAAA